MNFSNTQDYVGFFKHDWSDELDNHLQCGMEQLLSEMKERTKLLTEEIRKNCDAESIKNGSLIILWHLFEALLSWPLAYQNGAHYILEIAEKKGAKKTIRALNQALITYCKVYDLPPLPELSIAAVLNDLVFFKQQIAYVELICFLCTRTQALSQLANNLCDPYFYYEKNAVDLKYFIENEGHYFFHEMLEEVYLSYGSVLASLNRVEGLAVSKAILDEICNINQMIKIFQATLNQVIGTITKERVSEDLSAIQKAPMLFVGRRYCLSEIAHKKYMYRACNALEINYILNDSVGPMLDYSQAIEWLANVVNQVKWLKDWTSRSESIDIMLLKTACEGVYYSLEIEAEYLNAVPLKGLFVKIFKYCHQKIIKDIDAMKASDSFSSKGAKWFCDALLSLLEERLPIESDAMSLQSTTSSFASY